MQPLALNGATLAEYHRALFATHDYRMTVDLLRMDETPLSTITSTFLDGQANLQGADSVVRRTATMTLADPDRSLHLDADTPYEGATFSDRMIRVRHTIELPDSGIEVTATPFVGPIVRLSRDGDTLALECHDKAALAATGTVPFTVAKGMNAVSAIRSIMYNCTGERRFRLPSGTTLRLTRPYSVGWTAEASPWVVCQQLAKLLGMDLFYSCDGYLVLRRRPTSTVITVDERALTSDVQVDHDSTSVSNYVRVTAGLNGGRIAKTAYPPKGHPMYPGEPGLGRNDAWRRLPMLVNGGSVKSGAEAQKRADAELAKNLPMTAAVALSMVPVFHLDVDDVMRVETTRGGLDVRLDQGSIPLGVSGDMTVGAQRRISRGRRV